MWELTPGQGPLVAVALHHGHFLSPRFLKRCALEDEERLREEDPHTGDWTSITSTRVVVHRSRFEVDLNRPRERAVYLNPQDAWGLDVWKTPPSQEMWQKSLAFYDDFYRAMATLFEEMERRWGRFVVFDCHAYNHRRGGPDAPPDDPALNPDINIGTGTMDRTRWGPLVDRFISDLRAFHLFGKQLDVRENVKFRGGAFAHCGRTPIFRNLPAFFPWMSKNSL